MHAVQDPDPGDALGRRLRPVLGTLAALALGDPLHGEHGCAPGVLLRVLLVVLPRRAKHAPQAALPALGEAVSLLVLALHVILFVRVLIHLRVLVPVVLVVVRIDQVVAGVRGEQHAAGREGRRRGEVILPHVGTQHGDGCRVSRRVAVTLELDLDGGRQARRAAQSSRRTRATVLGAVVPLGAAAAQPEAHRPRRAQGRLALVASPYLGPWRSPLPGRRDARPQLAGPGLVERHAARVLVGHAHRQPRAAGARARRPRRRQVRALGRPLGGVAVAHPLAAALAGQLDEARVRAREAAGGHALLRAQAGARVRAVLAGALRAAVQHEGLAVVVSVALHVAGPALDGCNNREERGLLTADATPSTTVKG